MFWRKRLWLGSLTAVVGALLLALPAARSESKARTATTGPGLPPRVERPLELLRRETGEQVGGAELFDH